MAPNPLKKYFLPHVQNWLAYCRDVIKFGILTLVISFFFAVGRNLDNMSIDPKGIDLENLFKAPEMFVDSVTSSLIILITAEFSTLITISKGIDKIARQFVVLSLGLDATALTVILGLNLRDITIGFERPEYVFPVAAYWLITVITSLSSIYLARHLQDEYDHRSAKILEELGLGPLEMKRSPLPHGWCFWRRPPAPGMPAGGSPPRTGGATGRWRGAWPAPQG